MAGSDCLVSLTNSLGLDGAPAQPQLVSPLITLLEINSIEMTSLKITYFKILTLTYLT